MSNIVAGAQWFVANWQLLATVFSSLASVALFFLHGSAAADLKLLKDFVNSLEITQPNGPVAAVQIRIKKKK